MSRGVAAGKLLYGILFVVLLPFALAGWARATADLVPLPAVHAPLAGTVLAAAGLLLLIAGMAGLVVHGRGLPMNAFPPPVLVRRGVFRWLRNPIYLGFGMAVAGVAIASGSASGLWLVAPVTALAGAALVFGYERHDLARRFGPDALSPPLLSLPRGDVELPTAPQRAAVYAWVLLPWLLCYLAVQALGRPPDGVSTMLPLERTWPVWQWTELLYASAYAFVPLAPLLITTQRDLRRFAVRGLLAIVVVTLCWLTIPVVADNRAFIPAHPVGEFLAFEQRTSRGVAVFPAFHVLWALLAAQAIADAARVRGHTRWAAAAWVWGILIALSCLTTAAHSLVDIAGAVLLFLLLRDLNATWAVIRRRTEQLANSWHEWRTGPVRLLSYAVWPALAAGLGLLMAGMAAGRAQFGAICWIGACILVGAGLWAQYLEGSSRLLRPFGWYGGMLGAVLGALTASLAGAPLLAITAAFCLAAPLIQVLGRLRCLVQGCCHGGPAPAHVGIRYTHRRSRVTQHAHLAGIPIHPTPLYSIAGNLVIAAILLRLRVLGAPDVLVVGSYFMLGSLARFVEESYRAEPQTPVLAGLHLYQWLALASLLLGMAVTLLPPRTASAGFTPPWPGLLLAALGMALLFGVAMGVDFPRSNRRYSRLAPAD